MSGRNKGCNRSRRDSKVEVWNVVSRRYEAVNIIKVWKVWNILPKSLIIAFRVKICYITV